MQRRIAPVPKKRIPASVNVFKRDDGQWFVQAIDEHFELKMEMDLPERYADLPTDKRTYWLNRSVTELAKRMSKAASEKLQSGWRKKDGTEQRTEGNRIDPAGPGAVQQQRAGADAAFLPTIG